VFKAHGEEEYHKYLHMQEFQLKMRQREEEDYRLKQKAKRELDKYKDFISSDEEYSDYEVSEKDLYPNSKKTRK
jgi:hypothetical protein